MHRPSYSAFQGGPFKRVAKVILLSAFTYAIIAAIALGRKDAVTVSVGILSLAVLGIISLVELFQYWDDLNKWSAVQRESKKR